MCKELGEDKFNKMMGEYIRKLRISSHFTQADVAKVIKCSSQFISAMERGKHSFSAFKLFKILSIFGIMFDDFLDGYGI